MTDKRLANGFVGYMRWVVARAKPTEAAGEAPDPLAAAARDARNAFLIETANRSTSASDTLGNQRLERLTLLAASSLEEGDRPPELTTARGFQVMLAYDEGRESTDSSIGVLVQCPLDLVAKLSGQIAYLWSGSERFEIGEFDPDGKAFGSLPAGIEIRLADFASGKVQLETPDSPENS